MHVKKKVMENSNLNSKERESYSPFKTSICNFLRSMAKQDKSFKEKLMNPEKDIDKCLDYIIGEVKQSGRQGFADEEIYSLAMHYYDEPNESLKNHSHIANVKIIVAREMPFTEEEKLQARKQAFDELVKAEKDKLTKKKTTVVEKKEEVQQITLF